jgi:hypothetical protein
MNVHIKDFYVFVDNLLLYHHVCPICLVISLNLNTNLYLINMCPNLFIYVFIYLFIYLLQYWGLTSVP